MSSELETLTGESAAASGIRPTTLSVLHIALSLSPAFGGAPEAAIGLCTALARQGVRTSLYVTDLDELGQWSPLRRPQTSAAHGTTTAGAGVDVRVFPTVGPSRFAYSLAMDRELRRTVAGFDVVHIHSLYRHSTLLGADHAFRVGVPYIVCPHGVLDPYHRARRRYRKFAYDLLVQRRRINRASAIHFTSRRELELAAEVGLKPPALLVPAGIDLGNFENLPPRGAFRLKHPELIDKQLIVFLGRLAPQKGLDLLVKAFSIIATRHPNARLVLAGPDEGGHARRVVSWLNDVGLANRATFLGMIVGIAKLELLADTDVWVLPSYAENFGIAAVEAMACGLPIIISDRVGIADDVLEAKAGLVVPCAAEQLSEALCTVLESSQSQALGIAGKRLVHQRFTWEVAATRMIEAYERIRRH